MGGKTEGAVGAAKGATTGAATGVVTGATTGVFTGAATGGATVVDSICIEKEMATSASHVPVCLLPV